MDRSRQSYIYAGLTVVFWSTIPTAFKICLKELDILHMLTIASLTSAIVLFIVLLSGNKIKFIRQTSGKELLSSALLGLINPFIYYLILLKAYQLLPAQIAQPLNMIWPIVLVFLSVPILRQKIKKKSFAALFISLAGVIIISSQGQLFKSWNTDLKGVLLATGSSIFWALFFVLNVKDSRDEAVKLFLNFFFGTIYLIIVLAFTAGLNISEIGLRGAAAAVYIGIFEMGITFFFWLRALQLASSTDKVSTLIYLNPFISLMLVHFILHEPVYYTSPVGLLFIIAGIWIQNRKPVVI